MPSNSNATRGRGPRGSPPVLVLYGTVAKYFSVPSGGICYSGDSRGVAQMEARLIRDQEDGGSRPSAPTKVSEGRAAMLASETVSLFQLLGPGYRVDGGAWHPLEVLPAAAGEGTPLGTYYTLLGRLLRPEGATWSFEVRL